MRWQLIAGAGCANLLPHLHAQFTDQHHYGALQDLHLPAAKSSGFKVMLAHQHGMSAISFIGPPTPRSLKLLAQWMEERLYKNVTLI